MRYRLNKKLFHIENDTVLGPYDVSVEIMNLEEYKQRYPDLVPDQVLTHSLQNIHYCKADLLRDRIAGTFAIPRKENILGPRTSFGYYMDRTKLIFVDDDGNMDIWLSWPSVPSSSFWSFGISNANTGSNKKEESERKHSMGNAFSQIPLYLYLLLNGHTYLSFNRSSCS